MTRPFEGRTILITGAAGGFGSALARRFAGEGARLVLSDLSIEPLDALAAEIDADCVAQAGDVRKDETARDLVAAAVKRFGSLDVAINNAGIASAFKPLHETPVDEAERIMAVNLTGVVFAMRHQIPQMRAQFAANGSWSAIVNMASIAGVIGAAGLAVYAGAKHGVVGLSKSAALENARHGVRINCVCPTFSPTAMVTEDISAGNPDLDKLARGIPMRRLARVEEVVDAVIFAASPASSFLTGQAIHVDGGITAG
ncbi:SDR family NAD(P)-dependent oxidoreductase [Pararhizobium haloflavum]|uniref:SDR family NAD(P)-dependent oxidoreductase n=1 Tax=Pararhizobium haloflavum TaxID=2037914 RepID=UPI000C18A193|nr:glucose 1-dehydrogenase [Pararhizobium haloflavum]